MTIYCDTIEEFLDVIAGLVRRGLTFTAESKTFEIVLTGGY